MASAASPLTSRDAREAPSDSAYPRAVRVLAFVYAAFSLVAALTPPIIPVTPPARVVFWLASAFISLAVGILVTRSARPRRVLLGAGWLLFLLALILALPPVGDLLGLLGALVFSVSVLALLAGQVAPRTRKALVATHVVFSGSWLGVGAVMITLTILAATADDVGASHYSYRLLELFDQTILPWSSFGAILSGIAVSLTTKWGIVKHYWVFTKLVLAIVVLTCAFSFLHAWVVTAATESRQLAGSGGDVAELGAVRTLLIGGFAFAVSNVLAATVISVYKPWGMTQRGRREAQRRARTSRTRRTVRDSTDGADDRRMRD